MQQNKIFIDCGTHKGEGLTEFYNRGIIQDGFKVYCFEPIPDITNLESLKSIVSNNGKKLGDCLDINFSESAIWIKDGEVVFNSRNDHAAHIDGIGYTHAGQHVQKLVKCIDLANFINSLPTNSYIVCKMDIEGSEFEVLRHLIENHNNLLEKINEMYVEFHPHLMYNNTRENVNQLMDEVGKKTKIFLWH